MTRPNPRVSRWAEEVGRQRSALGLTAAQLPTPVVLSLIHMESAGDPHVHRPRSQYHGLLQMGRPAGLDVGLEDRGIGTTAELSGDGARAIELHMRYLIRYQSRHDWVPWRVAALWKGGPGTAQTLAQQLDAGATKATALAHAEHARGIPNLTEYVRRFDVAHAVYGGAT